jgi:hypothetical protein
MHNLALVRDTVGGGVVAVVGIVMIALVAAMVVALWVYIARRLARPADDTDPGIGEAVDRPLIVKTTDEPAPTRR